MDLKILALGDVTGDAATEYLRRHLPSFRRENKIDFTVVNGENCLAGRGNGIDKESFDTLMLAGADVVTTGNHALNGRADDLLDDADTLLRPANYPNGAPGHGVCTVCINGIVFRVINLIGALNTEGADNPFTKADRLLSDKKGDITIVDMHAEATSEKRAMGYYLDGRVTAVVGTHTHVQTADEQILPGGTAYITDLGMCGPDQSILGIEPQIIIDRFRIRKQAKFRVAGGRTVCTGAIITVNDGRAVKIERTIF